MQWASAISVHADPETAAQEILRGLRTGLGEAAPDLLLLFLSAAHGAGFSALADAVRAGMRPRHWGAVTARGVIGAAQEAEEGPGVAALAARLPDVDIAGRFVATAGLPDSDAAPGAWLRLLGLEAQARPHFLLFADPFGEVEPLLSGLDYAFPGSVTVGGLLSGGQRPGQNRLVWDGRAVSGGALLIALSGDLRLSPVVAQGCRPVGPEMLITGLEAGQRITGLDHLPPLAQLERLDRTLEAEDRTLLRQALFVGLAAEEGSAPASAGAYLIRNVMALDRSTGALQVAARLGAGMRMRFHVRDRASSRDDFAGCLARAVAEGPPPAAALLFNCLGRGRHLYGVPHHDVRLAVEHLRGAPVAGMFAAGEIGPVGGQTLVHGYTACLALVRPARG
jgi:small ligand-binding sensory domain FIST